MVKRIVLHWSAGSYYPREFMTAFLSPKIMIIVTMGNMRLIPVAEIPDQSGFVFAVCMALSQLRNVEIIL